MLYEKIYSGAQPKSEVNTVIISNKYYLHTRKISLLNIISCNNMTPNLRVNCKSINIIMAQ